MKAWHYALMVFAGGCSYGILAPLVKIVISKGYTNAEITAAQYLVGVFLCWICVLFMVRRPGLKLKDIALLLVSGFPMGLTGLVYYKSLSQIDASLAIILLFQYIWIAAAAEWISTKRRPSRRKIISILILLLGSVLASGILIKPLQTFSLSGCIWGLGAAVCYATVLWCSSRVLTDKVPLMRSALFASGGLIMVLLILQPYSLLDQDIALGLLPYALILGFFGMFLPPLFFACAMPHVGTSLGTILSASELPSAMILAVSLLNEQVSLTQWLGVGLILGAIVFANIKIKL